MLMSHFATPTSVGVWQTFFAMGVIYLVVMMVGAFGYRVPPTGWSPAGWTPPGGRGEKRDDHARNVHLEQAWKTPQFWLIWGVLCLNVSAGIGVLAMAIADAAGSVRRQADRRRSRLRRALRGPEEADRDDRGRVHGPAQPVQHPRPLLLGVAVGLHRPQEHLFRVLRARHDPVLRRRRASATRAACCCSSPRSASS